MFKQTFDLVHQRWKDEITGDGICKFADLICERPEDYSIDALPDEIKNKFMKKKVNVKDGGYKTTMTHNNYYPANPPPAHLPPPGYHNNFHNHHTPDY